MHWWEAEPAWKRRPQLSPLAKSRGSEFQVRYALRCDVNPGAGEGGGAPPGVKVDRPAVLNPEKVDRNDTNDLSHSGPDWTPRTGLTSPG